LKIAPALLFRFAVPLTIVLSLSVSSCSGTHNASSDGSAGAAGNDGSAGNTGGIGGISGSSGTAGGGAPGAGGAVGGGSAGNAGTAGTAGTGGGAGTGPKRIFHLINGTLGKLVRGDPGSGVEIADSQCVAAAAKMMLGGQWKAWISDSTVNAIDRIVDVGPWYRLDGQTKLFEDKQQLRSGPLAAINPDFPADSTDPRAQFWSGTSLDGTNSTFNCNDWTQYVASSATVGRVNVTGSAWVSTEPLRCDYYLALLCIEQ
jgi:hypothetical protein